MYVLYLEIYFYSKRGWAYFRQKPLLLILDSKGKGEQKWSDTKTCKMMQYISYTFTFHKGYFEMAILIYLKF